MLAKICSGNAAYIFEKSVEEFLIRATISYYTGNATIDFFQTPGERKLNIQTKESVKLLSLFYDDLNTKYVNF